ncbi:MAG: HDIG domain-containing metalloprotein [Microcoleaceae cyanobacterium]
MNTFQSLTQQIGQLCRYIRRPQSRLDWFETSRISGSTSSISSRISGWNMRVSDYCKHKFEKSAEISAPLLIVIAVVCLTGMMGVRFYNQPTLTVGKQAPETVIAPTDAEVIDQKSTNAKRNHARDLLALTPVLAPDSAINQEIRNKVKTELDLIDTTRKGIEPFPYYSTTVLSTDVQHYLRSAPESQWRELQLQFDQMALVPQLNMGPTNIASTQIPGKFSQPQNATHRKAYNQLKAYEQKVSPEVFTRLMNEVLKARKRYFQTINTLSQTSSTQSPTVKTWGMSVLKWSDPVWSQTKAGIERILQQMLTQGIAPGLQPQDLQKATQVQVNYFIPKETRSFANQLLSQSLETNLVKDDEATRQQAEAKSREILEVKVTAKAGDVIVEAGQPISQETFLLLDHFGKSERGVNWIGLLGFVGMICGCVIMVLLAGQRSRPSLRRRDYLLLLLLSLSTPLLILLQVPIAPNLPAVGLLAGSFYGSVVGVSVVSLLSLVLPIGLDVDMIPLIASAIGGIVGSLLAGQLRSREELALLGGAVGLAQGSVYLIIALILSATATSIWYLLLGEGFLQILVGLAWSIVALGLSPYLEHLFDVITPIRLAELANPNRPLLKRLATEAPGTFQHTMFVATLAEAAAQALGCNAELVRTGTLYHDIGKMHDPLGFIENQMGGPNKHDEIDDPWESARIIKRHVSEGLVMAKKCRLPKSIRAFIPEHQGNMLIAYFYHQAKQQALADPNLIVREEDFRYDGPIPQSKETAIMMLADSCEAALRSLKDATHEEALQMVNKILKARWQDKQLIDSQLKREEMPKIAEVFVRVWEQVNHKRIAYPKGVFRSR